MTSYRDLIGRTARAADAPITLVMKDHVLSYLIACVANDDTLGHRIVLKGGTAIRKCYVADYRFSEDLDYTVRDAGRLSVEELEAALGRIAATLPTITPVFVPPFSVEMVRVMPQHEAHPFGQQQGRIVVRTPNRAPISVKLEITGGELIIDTVQRRTLLHQFPEERLEQVVPAYSLEEIAAEKLRTFLQVADRLNRGRSEGRPAYLHRARDVYDIAMLRRSQAVDWSRVKEILPTKAEARGLAFTSADDFLDERIREAYQRLWQSTVVSVTKELLPFDGAWNELAGAASDMVSRASNGLGKHGVGEQDRQL